MKQQGCNLDGINDGDRGRLESGGGAMAGHHAVRLMAFGLLGGVMVRGVVVIEILAVDRLAGERQITEQNDDDQRAAPGKS